MSIAASVTYSADADRVGWLTFDDPAGKANVFNPPTLAALRTALDSAEADAPRALIVVSAKDRIFVAGADLAELEKLPDASSATEFARTGQKLFQRIADFPAPVVCAIHGACAGGGYEIALACTWRIASDASVTRIGLPETGLGLIPGWGGTARLPRLIGTKAAVEHLLKAQLLDAATSLSNGLIDLVVPAAELRTRAKAEALRIAAGARPGRATPVLGGDFSELLASTRKKTRGRLPALLVAIEVVAKSAPQSLAEALEAEAKAFGELAAGPVAKNLLYVFAVGEAAKKRTLNGWFPPESAPLPPVKRIGVVGAGVMGSGVAQWCAARGFSVLLRDVTPELVSRGVKVIAGLCEEAVKRGKMSTADASATMGRIATTTGWDGFESCDLVIEAIIEDVAAKQKLFRELAVVAQADALLVSNTSALPIEEIAGHVPNPDRTLGLHFFNPVSRMPLVEIIVGRSTCSAAAARALALVKALGKSPVICRSSPGFVVTRVLFFYLNEAVRLRESGVPTDRLDAAMRDWGWPMGPMRLIDEVGLDVTDFIFGEMAHYFPARFVRAAACAKLLGAGLRGRKTGAGFYTYAAGAGEQLNPAATTLIGGGELGLGPADIQRQLMTVMIDEAQRCLDEGVVKSAEDIDYTLLSGAGFPAFRGGLMRFARGARDYGG